MVPCMARKMTDYILVVMYSFGLPMVLETSTTKWETILSTVVTSWVASGLCIIMEWVQISAGSLNGERKKKNGIMLVLHRPFVHGAG